VILAKRPSLDATAATRVWHGALLTIALLVAQTCAAAAAPAPTKSGSGAGKPAASSHASGTAERELLSAAAARYHGLDAYEIRGTLTLQVLSGAPDQKLEAPFVVAYTRPGKLRDEFDNPSGAMLQISDGKSRIEYMPQMQQYRKHSHPVSDESIAQGVASSGLGFGIGMVRLLGMIGDSVITVSRLLDEKIDLRGETRTCAVIEATYPIRVAAGGSSEGPRRFWIDLQDHRVLRIRSVLTRPMQDGTSGKIEQITRFEKVQLGGPVADSLFTFVPPEGVRLVREWQTPGQTPAPDLTGSAAQDFDLADLQGKHHKLSEHQGQVVLIDFWATWCGPCRMTMPLVDKLEREYRSRGLIVYSINLRETHDAAAEYIRKKGYGVTTLLDLDGRVGDAYQVNGIPALFVIGKDGRIASQMVGVQPELELREAIEDAGIK
jgi:thiol-disulfide isomerase/thioredoxin